MLECLPSNSRSFWKARNGTQSPGPSVPDWRLDGNADDLRCSFPTAILAPGLTGTTSTHRHTHSHFPLLVPCPKIMGTGSADLARIWQWPLDFLFPYRSTNEQTTQPNDVTERHCHVTQERETATPGCGTSRECHCYLRRRGHAEYAA